LNNLLNIHSIFKSTEGEGVWVGTPQIFVRFQGCNIGCINCDSKETWDFEQGTYLTQDFVLKEIEKLSLGNTKRVAITGGDPLHPKHESAVIDLVDILKTKGFTVTIEAAGTRVVDKIFDKIDFINFDIKTPSTSVKFNHRPLLKLIEQYKGKSQIKSVIQDEKDFKMVCDLFDSIESSNKFEIPWVLTPCYEPKETNAIQRTQDILTWAQESSIPFRVILQQHKVIYGSDKTNV